MFTDLPLDELHTYRPPRPEPAGFDAFWQRTLDEVRAHDLDARFTEVDTGLALLRTHDVTFSGFGGHRIRGWFLLPRAADGPLPCVVQYLGYGGGRGGARLAAVAVRGVRHARHGHPWAERPQPAR